MSKTLHERGIDVSHETVQGFDSADGLRREAVAWWRRKIDRLAQLGAGGPEGGHRPRRRAPVLSRDG